MKRMMLTALACFALAISGCAQTTKGTATMDAGPSSWSMIAKVDDGHYVTTIYRVEASDGNEYIVACCRDGVSIQLAPPRKK